MFLEYLRIKVGASIHLLLATGAGAGSCAGASAGAGVVFGIG